MRPHLYILNEHDEPEPTTDVLAWGRWMETAERRICQDLDEGLDVADTAKRVCVSTVFLGVDHNHFGDGPPILWETMVFGGVLDGAQARYTSRDDAFVGHQEMCRKVSATIVRRTSGD